MFFSENGNYQPAMMTFKQFMARLDDSVDHLEAAKKFNEYKLDFNRRRTSSFFQAHMKEEWYAFIFNLNSFI